MVPITLYVHIHTHVHGRSCGLGPVLIIGGLIRMETFTDGMKHMIMWVVQTLVKMPVIYSCDGTSVLLLRMC